MKINLAAILLLPVSMVGCAERGVEGYVSAFPPPCSAYVEHVSSDKKYKDLLNWADVEIFSRNFSGNEFTVALMSGPGRKRSAIDISKSGIADPRWIDGADYEVRAISADLPNFDVIYIGGGKYRGVLIARNDAHDFNENALLNGVRLKLVRGRAAVVCYDGPG